jgi:hypothetical protein
MADDIIPADFEQLATVIGTRDPSAPLPRAEAFRLYSRYWFTLKDEVLSTKERDLILALEKEFGEKLFGTDGDNGAAPAIVFEGLQKQS